ncbi:MAG: DUF1416 domain-containing protein [Acidimicrobiia bacterium]
MPIIYGVALKDGEPTEGVRVKLVDDGGTEVMNVETAEDGLFEFEVKPGLWTLQWTTPEGREDEGEIEVPEGEDAEIELEV